MFITKKCSKNTRFFKNHSNIDVTNDEHHIRFLVLKTKNLNLTKTKQIQKYQKSKK